MPDISEIQSEVLAVTTVRGSAEELKPRDLAIGASVEVAELLDLYKWGAEPADKEVVGNELADVAIYVMRLANALDIDLGAEVQRKLGVNAEEYSKP